MKKILSLLVLLVTTLSAFALDFTDYRKVTLGYNTPTESNDAKLNITDNGDGTYNVTFNDIITVDGSYTDNYGTFTFSNVSGSTSGDVTTVTVADLAGTVSGGDYGIKEFSNGNLSLKFKDGKAYATMTATCKVYYSNYTFNVVFGTDEGFEGGGSTGGGSTGGEVTEKYTVNFDKTAYSTHSGRVLNSFSLQQTGKEKQTESVSASRAAYEDHTSKVFTVEAGSELTASFNYSGVWMNGYVYIDRDNDGEFSYKEGQWDQAGTDLVAYSFYSTLANPKVNDGSGYNSTGASVTGDDRSNVNPPSFTAPTEPGTYRIRFKIDWNCILPGGSTDILSDGGGIWDATLVVEEAQVPTPTVVAEKTFTDAISMVGDDFSTELGEATVTVKEMSDETINMTLSVTTTEGTTEYTASGFTKTVDADKNRTTYAGTLNIEGEDFNVNALVYTENEEEKLYFVATSYYKYVIGTDPDYVAPVTEVSNKNYTSNLRIYDADAEEPVNVVEKDEAVVNIVKNSDDTYKVTLKDIAWGEHAATDLVFVGSADAGIMSDKLDGEEETEQDVSIMAVPDDATAAVLGEGTQAMFQWTEKAEDAIEMAFYLQVGTTTYAGEFNYEKETPETPEITKVVEDGYAPAGDKFSFPFTCDFAKQKLVCEVDFTNAGYTSNQLVFTIATSDADLSAWSPAVGGNAHFYFTKSTTGNKLVLHYLHSGTRIDVDNIAVENVAKFTLDAEGFHVGDVLAVPAAKMPKLYEGGKDFLFGSQEGNGRSNAVYNYVMVVPLDWTEPTTPFEAVTKTATDVAYTTYNGTTTNYDANTVEVTEYEQDKYKVTYKDLTVGNTRLGDLTIDGVTATVGENNVVTLSTEATEATWSNVSDNQIVLTLIPNETSAISNFAATLVPGTEDNTIEKLNLTVNVTIGGEEAKVVFGEQYVPELPEPTVYTDQAKTSYYGDAEYTDKVVNVYDLGENKYKVVYKEYNLGTSTKFDLVYNNVEGTTDEDGYTTYTFDGKATAENVTIESGIIASVNEGDEVDATLNGKSKDGKLYATFTMSVMGGTSTTVYGTEFTTTPEEPEVFCKENYVADGTGFEWDINVDWDTQKIVMSIDPSTCTGNCEDVIGLGAVPTAWNNTLHLYRTSADQMLQGYFQTSATNNNTGKFAETAPFLVEVSKAQGFVVNGEVKIASSAMSYLFTLPTVKMGTGEGANDKSRATYNYVKVVDKDWTKDPETGINATTVAEGEFEVFSVDGVKLSKLQKGLNIVRSADGKVKKVLVK